MARAKGATKKKVEVEYVRAPGRPPKVRETTCTRCGKVYPSKAKHFNRSRSPLFFYNDRYFPICRNCIIDMYEGYIKELGNERDAIRRICMKLDIYWNDTLYNSVDNSKSSTPKIMTYIKNSNLNHYKDKNYDTTLEEEKSKEAIIQYAEETEEDQEQEVPKEIIDFWGSGLTASYYRELEHQLKKWTDGRRIEDIDIGEITVIKKICLLEVMINQDVATGNNKAVEKNVRALDALLGSANLKPVQKVSPSNNNDKTGMTPFGVWIKKIEDERPIPEPEEKFKDVDGIAKYISVWFLGHLSKVLNVSNRYSNLYEEEIAKLTVERPEYEGYDDEEVLEDIFERAKKEAKIEEKRIAEKIDGGDDDANEG